VLDIDDVLPYLLERELVSARAVVDGELRIVDMSRRNRVFVVSAGSEPGCVIKQGGGGDFAGVRHEASVLERLRAAGPRLAAHLPVPIAYDPADGVLVLEAARDPQDLRERHARGRFSQDLAAQAGRALALLHDAPSATLDDGSATPWDAGSSLRLHRPSLRHARELSGATIELVRAIQHSDELCGALDELHASRHEAAAIVHGDVRWENLLTAANRASARRSRLLLIDWESAAHGDPSVDLGAFFGEYLHAWVRSIPIADPRDPGRLLARAGRPLARMRPALSAFWLAYSRAGEASADELARRLRRAASWSAVRVLTCAYEASASRNELSGNARFALQLSSNVLRRPDEAIAHLLGIGASWR
jgi:aminoglycoside phosphotransferase (APT) family kinase protein